MDEASPSSENGDSPQPRTGPKRSLRTALLDVTPLKRCASAGRGGSVSPRSPADMPELSPLLAGVLYSAEATRTPPAEVDAAAAAAAYRSRDIGELRLIASARGQRSVPRTLACAYCLRHGAGRICGCLCPAIAGLAIPATVDTVVWVKAGIPLLPNPNVDVRLWLLDLPQLREKQ